MDKPEFSVKELMEEYWRLLESSKEKDPSKNPLFLEIQGKINTSMKGYALIAPYEIRMELSFVDFWREYFGEQHVNDYMLDLHERMDISTDSDNLLKLEMVSLHMDVTNYKLTGDLQLDGKKLGYLIAVKGDNPSIASLVHEITAYPFGIRVHVLEKNDDFFNENYWLEVQRSYQEVFRKLHWVNMGYSSAKKLHEIKKDFPEAMELSYIPEAQRQPTLVNTIEPNDKWTLKQQLLLMQKLGILDLPVISGLSMQNQGKLLARLLGKNEKNTEDLIRYRKGKNVDSKFKLDTLANEKQVLDLLKELGIQNSSY
jgi:hypothetical protein